MPSCSCPARTAWRCCCATRTRACTSTPTAASSRMWCCSGGRCPPPSVRLLSSLPYPIACFPPLPHTHTCTHTQHTYTLNRLTYCMLANANILWCLRCVARLLLLPINCFTTFSTPLISVMENHLRKYSSASAIPPVQFV